MFRGKKILAIIPARGGSKGLPKKNILPISGKPLIIWTIDRAKNSKYLDRTLVSTDCKEIAKVALDAGAEVPFLRPDEFSTDTSPTMEAIEHTVSWLESEQSMVYDYILLLEPTSPLREEYDIDNMIEILIEKSSNFDSIVSIGEVDEHPSIVKRIQGEQLAPFCRNLPNTTRRQDNEPAYFPYGVGYLAKTETLLQERTFNAKRCTFYKIKKYQNYEIDDIYGFWCVENIMRNVWKIA
ncbi:acylneuraminate cytidylyltransferase family protein [Alphaproteobacteria bacterium]|nr:acylneuraminate cytidylyltransferase family protein [Alphaproteobacteria bacterium]